MVLCKFIKYISVICLLSLPSMVMAAFAPPLNDILPKLTIHKLTDKKLYLNHNIVIKLDDVTGSWGSREYFSNTSSRMQACHNKELSSATGYSCMQGYRLRLKQPVRPRDEGCESYALELVNTNTEKVTELNKQFTDCTEITDVYQDKETIWLAAHWQGGHGDYHGEGLVKINIDTGKTEFVARENAGKGNWPYSWKDKWSKEKIYSLEIDKKDNSIWFTSSSGIHNLNNNNLKNYFYKLYIDAKGSIQIGLIQKQPDHDLEMFNEILSLKIKDILAFAKVWTTLDSQGVERKNTHPDMVPVYIDKLKTLTSEHKDSYIFSSLVGRILEIEDGKFAPQIKILYSEVSDIGQKESIAWHLKRSGYIVEAETINKLAAEFLSAFLESKKKAYELCYFYKKNNIKPDAIDSDELAKSGKRLSGVLDRCFDENLWSVEARESKTLLTNLYMAENFESKQAICGFLNQRRLYEPDGFFLKQVIQDLPAFHRKYGYTACFSWLLDTIKTDKQMLLLQGVKSNDRLLHHVRDDLIMKLLRRRDFPVLHRQAAEQRKQAVDNCRMARRNETFKDFQNRCRDNKNIPMAQPYRGKLVLPPPPKDGGSVFIDRSPGR